MATRLQPYGRQVFLGVRSADGRIFPKGQRRGPTALRKAFLACPKTIPAPFLRAFESTFKLRVIGLFFPNAEATGNLPKII